MRAKQSPNAQRHALKFLQRGRIALADRWSARALALFVGGTLVAATLGGCQSMALGKAQCFSRTPGVLPPIPELVRAKLSHGQSGQDLYAAVMAGDVARVGAMLEQDPALKTLHVAHPPEGRLSEPGQVGDLMTFAVANCDVDMVATLIDAGVDPNGGVWRGTPLGFAVLADTPTMAELLLRHGAVPDPQKGHDGATHPAYDALSFGNVGAIRMLVRHGLDVKWVDSLGMSTLHRAMNMEQFESAEVLVQAGANLWLVGMGGVTPAHELGSEGLTNLSPGDAAAKRRLAATAQQQAAAMGLPWPLPPLKIMRQNILDGSWPTAAMTAGGMRVSPEGMAHMRQQASRGTN